ncbi:hypothetical protein BTA51_01885 [Hahella sp. CCB-MM4]|uniref:hypothetical protein n=1 Tax=Hahella sp. (strain CCB-MM4) TaxID=1926491 RepID=UPI000B9A78E3|nr:hypothetical protein [Hahella sp. CCB-MM4]OZG75159.1 hypothetical protein BTA51_01885 [Hahella sp. CCB-MM4]
MTTNTIHGRQTGFVNSWAALAILIAGLILTGSATYLVTRNNHSQAYASFIREAGSLQRQLEREMESARFHAQLASELIRAESDTIGTLIQGAKEISSIEILQTSPLGPIAISLPETLARLEPRYSYLEEDQAQDTLLRILANHNPQMLSPQHSKQSLQAGQAETIYLIPRKDTIYAVSIDLGVLLQNFQTQAQLRGLSVSIYDLGRFSSDPFITLNPEPPNQTNLLAEDRRWQYQNTVTLPDMDWMLRMAPTMTFQNRFDSHMALLVFVAGTLVSALLALLASVMKRR